MNKNTLWALTFTLLWFCDAILAAMMVSKYGLEAEANLIPRIIMSAEYGIFLFLTFKLWVWVFWQFAKEQYRILKKKEITYWLELVLSLILLPAVVLSFLMVIGI